MVLSNKRITKAPLRLHILCLCCLQPPENRFSRGEAQIMFSFCISGPMRLLCVHLLQGSLFLAQLIGISAVFAHMRKFYLTYPVPAHGKDKNRTATLHSGRTSICEVIVILK